MTQFTIKDLADFSGIKPHTIRIWEQRFTFLRPNRTETARRIYNPDELNLFLEVMLLNQNGHKISKIANMTIDEKLEAISQMDESKQKLRAINELIIAMAEMDKEKFDMILEVGISCWGLHPTIQQVLIPFAEKIGLMEDPDNKYYIENISVIEQSVKQKIYLGIERRDTLLQKEKTVLLFHTPGEQQRMNLLVLQYLLETSGFRTLHITSNLSLDNLETIIRYKKPAYIVTHPSKKEKKGNMIKFVSQLKENLPETQFITIGEQLSARGIEGNYKHAENIQECKLLII